MAEHKVLPNGDEQVITDTGTVLIRRLSSGLILLVMKGYMSVACYDLVVGPLDRELKSHGSLLILVDGERWDNYETAFRERWTRWFISNRKQLKGIHILVTSMLVTMGIKVANMAAGGLMATYPDRTAFEALASKLVPGQSALRS